MLPGPTRRDNVPSGIVDASEPSEPGPRIVAIVPVGTLDGAKSRLGEVLDAEERHDLATRLTRRTIAAAVAARSIVETLVITPDDEVRAIALEAGARPMRQRSQGLNDGLREAREEAVAAGADAVLIIPVDLPRITPAAIDAVAGTLGSVSPPLVAMVPDRHERGTNALLLAPPDVIDVRFGGNSRAAHAGAAAAAGASLIELGGPLTLDLDTAEDLLLVQRVETLGV
jgi:2-phospho-L-lactate guanylyltransferase